MKRLGLILLWAALASASELRMCIRSEPKTFDPALSDDDASRAVLYLTGGVLVRVNRATQELEPALALSWKVTENGRAIELRLREGVTFSDGTPFSAADVAYTFKRLMDPALHSPIGDTFRSGEGAFEAIVASPARITLRFPAPVAGLDRLLDQVAIQSERSAKKEVASLGPFTIAEHKAGAYLLLARNPHYWKRDSAGKQLPYLDSIRLDIQQNREAELLRFERGEIQLVNSLDPEYFDRLAAKGSNQVVDAGPSTDVEFLWFNQVASSPIAAYKRAWFRTTEFRRAISEAVNREDICRLVYRGHARPAAGPVSTANRLWYNSALKPETFDSDAARRRLESAGFRYSGGVLRDSEGHAVEFTLLTNAGNKPRERTAALIQDDLAKLGIKVTIAALDFPSVLERISRTNNYDACLLGLVDVGLDPNAQMNVWLSSSEMHPWNPKEAKPETAWEADIDKLMRQQASALDPQKRKAAFDQVQQIVRDQAPIIYLVNKNALAAVSPSVKNAQPVALRPQTYWNAERLVL